MALGIKDGVRSSAKSGRPLDVTVIDSVFTPVTLLGVQVDCVVSFLNFDLILPLYENRWLQSVSLTYYV